MSKNSWSKDHSSYSSNEPSEQSLGIGAWPIRLSSVLCGIFSELFLQLPAVFTLLSVMVLTNVDCLLFADTCLQASVMVLTNVDCLLLC